MHDGASLDRANSGAHLTGAQSPAPPIHRYPPAPDLAGLIRNFWIPVWDLHPGESQTQQVLQYPVCVIVIASDYARFYGPTSALSSVDLSGCGWAVGVLLQPAAGRMLWSRPVATMTDRDVPIETLTTIAGASLRDRVRGCMQREPANAAQHAEAIAAIEAVLRTLLPVDAEGATVNRIVEMVEGDPALMRVDQLAAATGMGERALQRLTRDRLGLSPKWLIQRRRLHEAVARIKTGEVSLADLAHSLGYADQAHFTRDFARATGTTPGAYLADQP